MKSFPQVDTFSRQREFKVRVFSLLGELPKAVEPHIHVCQVYRWQLCSNKWYSPTTNSLDPIVVTAICADFHGNASGPPLVDLPAIVQCQ